MIICESKSILCLQKPGYEVKQILPRTLNKYLDFSEHHQ